MVHVEIFLGGETGESTLGARWQKGRCKVFDSYKFTSKNYHSIEYHFRSDVAPRPGKGQPGARVHARHLTCAACSTQVS